MQLKDYGDARQITLFEHGRVALQILTSDPAACPADILSWLRSRWRQENFLKYASENYGMDKICDYLASIETNTKLTRNPACDQANAAVRDADKTLAAAERGLAALLAGPGSHPCRQERPHPGPGEEHHPRPRRGGRRRHGPQAGPRETARPRHQPGRETALLRAGRRGLQMVLRLLAHNAEHWLSGHLNAYLRDDDEDRAITRQTIIRGLAGTITYAPAAITVTLEQPAHGASPAPWNCSLTRSTQSRPPSPATPAPSTTKSPRTAFNCDHPITGLSSKRLCRTFGGDGP